MENTPKTLFVRDMKENDSVRSPFLVKFSAIAVGKTGKSYMNLVLMDRTVEVEARIWEDVPHYAGQAVRDAFVLVEGKCQLFQGRRQVVVKSLRVLREDEVDPKEYVEESVLDAEVLYKKLASFVESVEDPHYRALAQ